MKNKSLLEAQVKIGSVLQKSTPAFKALMGKKLDKFLVTIDKEIADHLEQMGELLVETIKESMWSSSGGTKYTYVDTKGNIVDEHVASVEFNPPSPFQENLINSLEYRVERWSGVVRIGVYTSGVGNQYPTIAYYSNYKMRDGSWLSNVVIVGPPGGTRTPIKEYARMLEEEQNRPFIHNIIQNKAQEFKEDLRKELRDNLSSLFKGKKPPVYFRLYIK